MLSAEHCEAAGTERRSVLSDRELGVAKANLKFALENCPVDGGVEEEDGDTTSRESVEALLERLDAVGANSIEATDLSEDEVKLLKAVGDYALEGCPIEGGMMRDDGSLVTRAELKDFREKIGALTPATAKR